MTTIVRIGDKVYTDSKWAEESPEELNMVLHRPKLFKHSSNHCVIAYSGSIGFQTMFVALDALIANIVENIADVLIKAVPDNELLDSLYEASKGNSCTILIMFSHLTFVLTTDTSNNKMICSIKRSNELVVIGSGSNIVRSGLLSMGQTIEQAFENLYKRDPLSGGTKYVTDISSITRMELS